MGEIINEIFIFLWHYLKMVVVGIIFGLGITCFWFVAPALVGIVVMIVLGGDLGTFGLPVGIFVTTFFIIFVIRPIWDNYFLAKRLSNAFEKICF